MTELQNALNPQIVFCKTLKQTNKHTFKPTNQEQQQTILLKTSHVSVIDSNTERVK